MALHALARLALGETGALSAAESALIRLRALDSKAHLAYTLDALAEHEVRVGRPADAQRRAEEALLAAEAVGQASEAAVARALLARLAFDRGEGSAALAHLEACRSDSARPLAWSARAARAVARAAEHAGVTMLGISPPAPGGRARTNDSTPAPTVAQTASRHALPRRHTKRRRDEGREKS